MTGTPRGWTAVIALTVLLAACGGDTVDEPGEPSTSGSETTTGAPESSQAGGSGDTASSTTTSAEPATEGSPATGSGDATITLGDSTVEFTGFVCYYDEDAVDAANGDEDAIFVGGAQDGDAALGVLISDRGLQLFEVYYQPGDGTIWYMNSTDVDPSYTFEDGRITAEADFDHVVDSAEVGTEHGSMEATCG